MSTKFEFKDTRPFKEKAFDFSQSLLFWRGRKKGRVWTRDIDMGDIREIFFPQTFEEKYSYLGSVPYNEDSELFKAMYPLILAAQHAYEWAIKNGIAKEQARVVLPEGNTVSRLYMNGTLRSWIHFIELRSANGTQKEHRQVAIECAKVIAKVFPMANEFITK